MDPIENGSAIFRGIAGEFGDDVIAGSDNVKHFFHVLLEQTSGWVILDFLDAGNWDCIEGFSFDDENDILTLIWHDYRNVEESPEEKASREGIFPASLYSLAVNVQNIVPIYSEHTAIFLINGFSRTEKEIRRLYQSKASDFRFVDNSFFSKRIVQKVDNKLEIIDFHCTPIYSLAVIPKNVNLSSLDSKQILYHYNIRESLGRLTRVHGFLGAAGHLDDDVICEKVGTARRVLEFVLKIECCFRNIHVKNNYSRVLLGPLSSLVKDFKTDEEKLLLDKMAELLNEFAHDTGKPVDLGRARSAVALVSEYTKLFQREVSSK